MKRVIFSTSLAFMTGLVVAASLLFFYLRWRLSWSDSVHVAASASSHLATLRLLRAGDTNTAVKRLETSLSAEIIVLETMPQSDFVTGILSHAKEYRERVEAK
jgi:hypothetical protein